MDRMENANQDIIGKFAGVIDTLLEMDIRLCNVENIPKNEEAEMGSEEHEDYISGQESVNSEKDEMEPEFYDHGSFEDAAHQDEKNRENENEDQDEKNLENENEEMNPDEDGDH